MCGIVGVHAPSGLPVPEARITLRKMLASIRHRGPDDAGLFEDDKTSLGHARLSIIDLASGHQPIADETQRRWIVFNGEIYNFRELRGRLPAHRFRTDSDTEVILHLYEEQGPDCVRSLDGMFAIAIRDEDDLFLARDPLGIKPLYFANVGHSIFFASEARALSGVAGRIHEFPPGFWFHSKVGLQRYFDLVAVGRGLDDGPVRIDEATVRVRSALGRAVRKRLVADVPVGVLLSGGLDSSVVAYLARRDVEKLHTFSTGLEGSPDIEAARDVARHLGTKHHEKVLTKQEIVDALPRVVQHLESYDLALVRSAVANWFVAELAATCVKVVLTGEGADELFGGYEYLTSLPEGRIHQELLEITGGLHNHNLQRCDRMTMAHGVEGRVPFLDVDVLRTAFAIPSSIKIRRLDGRPVQKWVLRKAYEGMLPDHVVWRAKQKFSLGSRVAEVTRAYAEEVITEADFARSRSAHPEAGLVSKEETLYYRLFESEKASLASVISVGKTRHPEGS